jgi:hypothetical protein
MAWYIPISSEERHRVMIDIQEHFYRDDPAKGHPDVRTRLRDVSYFFLGNGCIQAAVQFAPSGEGTPIGLVIMNPEKLSKKRDALTMDKSSGIESTMIRFETDRGIFSPKNTNIQASWSEKKPIPAVEAAWANGRFQVTEYFYCPKKNQPVLAREVRVKNLQRSSASVNIQTGVGGRMVDKKILLPPGREKRVDFRYSVDESKRSVHLERVPGNSVDPDIIQDWTRTAQMFCDVPQVDFFSRLQNFNYQRSFRKKDGWMEAFGSTTGSGSGTRP